MIDRIPGRRGHRGSLRRRAVGALRGADQAALRHLRTRGHGPSTELAMRALGRAGDHAAAWAAIGVAGALADPARRRRWLAGAATGPVAIAINYAVKVAVGRRRPLIHDHPRLGRAPTELSFPSAHATSSVAAAIALGRVEPRLRPALLLLAATLCAGRPYLGMHYPSDVLAGAALGVVIGSLAPGVGVRPDEDRLIDLAIGAGERPRGGDVPSAALAGGAPRPA